MSDVITFGSAVIDIFVDTDISEKQNFISYPIGAKILIKKLRYDIGGGGTNTAVAFSRLGLKTGYLGKLGNDENAKKILNCLKKEKVKFLGKISKNEETGASIILDSKEKDRTILTYKGANDNLSFKEINLKKMKTKWLYCSSLVGNSFETQKKIIVYLKKRGVKIAFNPSEYIIKKKKLNNLLRLIDILILNRQEAEMLTKKNDLLIGLSELCPGIIVITDKDKKISCYDGINKYFLMPHKRKVVERTGAGDAFASGFVAGQIRGKSIPYSLNLGLRESENVIGYFGAKNNLLRINLK